MKHAFKLMALCILACASFMQSCKKDDPEPEPDAMEYLQNTWQLGSTGFVKQDNVDKTNDYQNLTLTFKTDFTYTASNAGKLFYPSGIWTWSPAASSFMLDNNVAVEVLEISQHILHIKFHLDVDDVNASGRADAVVGNYEIMFKND